MIFCLDVGKFDARLNLCWVKRMKKCLTAQRGPSLIIQYLWLLPVIMLLAGCSPEMTAQKNHASRASETSVTLANETGSLLMPLIDATAPSIVETASFGLG
jgi:hypothetical protein